MLVSGVSRPRSSIDPEAVAAAFAPDGLHGVSAADVARRAGVAKPTLYAHGRSKDAVFLACVEAEVERLLNRLYVAEARTREQGAAARASALALALLDHARAHPEAFRLLHVTARHRTSTVAAAVDGALDRIPARIASVLRRDLIRHDDPTDLATTAATALYGAVVALAASPLRRKADRTALAAALGAAVGHTLRPLEADVAAGSAAAPARGDVGIY